MNTDSKSNDTLVKSIEHAINRHCAENGSDTPDFILAEYLIDCLKAYDRSVTAREKWYGRGRKFSRDGHGIPVGAPVGRLDNPIARPDDSEGAEEAISSAPIQPKATNGTVVDRWCEKMGRLVLHLDSDGQRIDPLICVWDPSSVEQLEAWVVDEAKRLGLDFPKPS